MGVRRSSKQGEKQVALFCFCGQAGRNSGTLEIKYHQWQFGHGGEVQRFYFQSKPWSARPRYTESAGIA
jgi:hypothetical protein